MSAKQAKNYFLDKIEEKKAVFFVLSIKIFFYKKLIISTL